MDMEHMYTLENQSLQSVFTGLSSDIDLGRRETIDTL